MLALAPADPCKLHDRKHADDDDCQGCDGRLLVGATRRFAIKMGSKGFEIERPQQERSGKLLDAIHEDQQCRSRK